MNKVTTINLNGRAYQLEERGFEILRKYLDTAAAKLADNPDKDEIMADFEQAIADKFDQRLSPAKNVISEKEVDEIIAAMGPVEGEAADAGEKNIDENKTESASESKNNFSGSNSATGAPKRLYRIPAGEWLMGVCNGLAAYFNIDVTLVRIIFVLLTLITHAFWIIAYIVLAIVMPPVRNEEQFANAHGWSSTRPPLNANDFIEQTKKRYAEWRAELEKMHEEHKAKEWGTKQASSVKEDVNKWKHDFKKEMREKKQRMKQEWRAQQRDWRENRRAYMYGGRYDDGRYDDRDAYDSRRYGAGYGISRAIFGFFAVLVSIILLAIAVAWITALYTLIKYGTVFGYAVGAGHPLWMSIVFMLAAFYVVTIPFRLLLQHAWGHARYQSGGAEFGRFLVFIVVCAILIWTARELFPQVNTAWNTGIAWLKMKL